MRNRSRHGDARAQREGTVIEDFEIAEATRRRFPVQRWLLAIAAAILLGAAWLGWRNDAPLTVQLPIVNSGDTEVRLLLHGDGVLQHALVHLPPGRREVVTLSAGHGVLRVQSESERAKIEALLLDDVRALKDAHVQLEVRSASELVLAPRSD